MTKSSGAGSRWLALVEVVGYAGALTAYVVLLMPVGRGAGVVDFIVVGLAAVVPVAVNWAHGDGLREAGVRVDNLGAAARVVVPVTLVMAVGVAGVGLASGGFHWVSWETLGDKLVIYLAWGPMQQYLLCGFALRRLRTAGHAEWAAIVVSAAAFAVVHAPNWPLVGLTLAGGLAWCRLFGRAANIFVLGLAHGALAVLVYHAWPDAWLERLTIGRMYMERVGL